MSGPGPHRFDPTILREYDIRGVVGETLDAADAYAVGRSFGTVIARESDATACVGRDGRLTSPEFEAELVRGLTDCGVDVVRVGLGPTPMLYFARHVTGSTGGVMVSGSHNPPEYNGFKLVLAARPFHGADILDLGTIAGAGAWTSGRGSVSDEPMLDRYVERLAADYTGARPLRVVWDAGNGSAGTAMQKLAARLPGEHVLLNETIDGTFPAHHPDPTVAENLEQLRRTVLGEKADLGIGFDGDGDRIGVVDDTGGILWGDQLMAFLAADVLEDHPGATVIADVKASQALFDRIAAMGGQPVMWKTGHSLIKAAIPETGALLAGEMSGHIFFADRYYGYDDALYAAVRLLGWLSRQDRGLSELRRAMPELLNTPEMRFHCAEERKFGIVEQIRNRLAESGAEICDIDGVRVSTGDGWWLLRASNTQAALVARCESDSEDGLERLKQSLSEQLRGVDVEPPEF